MALLGEPWNCVAPTSFLLHVKKNNSRMITKKRAPLPAVIYIIYRLLGVWMTDESNYSK